MSIYRVDSLDEKTTDQLDTLLENKLEDVKPSSSMFEYWKSSRCLDVRVNTKMSETSRKLVELAKTYFDKAGLKVNENNGYIYYTSYEINHPKYDKNDYSYVHCANEEFCWVHRCVFITRKDHSIKGGDLDVYKEHPNTFLRMFGLDEDPEKDTTYLKKGSVFVCSGNTLHQFLNCGGSGRYNIINVTLYNHKRQGYSYDNDNDDDD